MTKFSVHINTCFHDIELLNWNRKKAVRTPPLHWHLVKKNRLFPVCHRFIHSFFNCCCFYTIKAAELDGSARIWICTPWQTPTETLAFWAKTQQLSDVAPMRKQQRPPLKQLIIFGWWHAHKKAADAPHSSNCFFFQRARSPTDPRQTDNDCHSPGSKADEMGSKCGTTKQEQVWHHEMGASAAPCVRQQNTTLLTSVLELMEWMCQLCDQKKTYKGSPLQISSRICNIRQAE